MNLKIPQAVKKGYIECQPGGVFDWGYPTSKLRRGRVQGGVRYARQSPATAYCSYMKERNEFIGVSEAFNHALEWRSGKRMIHTDICPALRATDYKCPKYVWYETIVEPYD